MSEKQTEANESIKGAKSGPAYTHECDAIADEGELDDLRLQAMFLAGMPADAPRVRLTYSGGVAGPQYNEYLVEFFGIRTETPPETEAELKARDGSAQYWYSEDPESRYMDIWLARVRWKQSAAVYEEAWIRPKGWSAAIRDLPIDPRVPRERDCLGLLKGAPLVLMVMDLFPKRGRPPRLSDEDEVESLKMAAYKIGRQKQAFSVMRLANVSGVSRNTLKTYLDKHPDEAEQIKAEHRKGRRDILADPWGGLGPSE